MTACVGALAVREVVLCVKCGHFFAQTLYGYACSRSTARSVRLGIPTGCGRVKHILSRTSWGAYRARNQKSKTAVARGRPLRSRLPSRIFDNGYGSASSWSWEFALFVGSGPSAASLAGVHGWLKKPWIGGFHVAPFSSVNREDLLHSIPSARYLNAARRRARAHPCHHQRGGRR